MENWIYFALLTVLLWGAGNVLIKKGYANISALWSIVISATINFIVYVPFALSQGATFSLDPRFFLPMFFITFFYILFFYAIEKGQLSFSGTIFATYPVTTLFLSSLFLSETIGPVQWASVAFILLGTVFLTLWGKKTKSKKNIKLAWIAWAVLGSVTTGAADFLAKVVIDDTSLNTYNLFYPLFYILALAVFWLIDRNGRKLPKGIKLGSFKYTIAGIIMLTCGLLSFNYALALGQASLVVPMSSSYVALTVVLSYFLLKDPISKKQLLSLLLIIIGVILIGL